MSQGKQQGWCLGCFWETFHPSQTIEFWDFSLFFFFPLFLTEVILGLNIHILFYFFLKDQDAKLMICGDHLLGFQVFHPISQNLA